MKYLVGSLTIAILVLASCASSKKGTIQTGLTRDQMEYRSKLIKSPEYSLNLDLHSDPKKYSGVVKAYFWLKSTDDIFYDFAGGKVEQVSINGKTAEYRYDGQKIYTDEDYYKKGKNSVVITFSHKYSTNAEGFYRFEDPADNSSYVYTDFEPFKANELFPSFDQPNLKAKYKLTVRAPKHWTVISYDYATEIKKSKDVKTWFFPQSPIFSTYILNISAGPFSSWDSTYTSESGKVIPMKLYARKSLAEHVDVNNWFSLTKRGMEYYEKYFDYEYPFNKYDQILVPDFNWSGMENVAAVTYTERFIFKSRPTEGQLIGRSNVILHELAHMWFGNLVTMDWWNGLWLNESFATLMAYEAMNEITDLKGIWQNFAARTKGWAYWTDQLVTTHPIEVPVTDTDTAFSNFDGITYGKGASALKQLHFLLGDNFQKGLQIYFKKHANKNTQLSDFFNAMEESSGNDLDRWVDEWIKTAGLNSIRPEFTCSEGKVTKFTLVQEAPADHPTLRTHRAKIGLYNLVGNKLEIESVVDVIYSGKKTEIDQLVGANCPELVHPNVEDYDYVKVVLDPVSLAFVEKNMAKVQDNFVRQMLWVTIWEMVHDAKLPLLEFYAMAKTAVVEESDYKIKTFIMGKLFDRVPEYITFSDLKLDEYEGELAALAKSQFLSAVPKSDLQKEWYSAFLSVSNSSEDLQLLESLLNGKRAMNGFELDQDMRWDTIVTLNRRGYENAQSILAMEETKDLSSSAKKSKIASLAARPNLDSKRQWFQMITKSKTDYSLSELTSVMENLFPREKADWKKYFEDDFYAELQKLSETKQGHFLEEFSKNLIPTICRQENVEKISDYIKNNDSKFPISLVKTLRISNQENQRCVEIVKNIK